MATNQFDRTVELLATSPSRRHLLGGMLGVLACGALGSAAPISARGKKGKGGKRRPGKGKKPQGGQGRPARPAPPAPQPVSRADATCELVSDISGLGVDPAQLAQTFRAQRTGQLTSASVVTFKSDEGAALDVEIWSVNQNGAPDTFLAGATIADIPLTDYEPARTLTATFPTPANVVAGTRYALVVGFGRGECILRMSTRNPCGDGNVFVKAKQNAAWVAQPTFDVEFSTVVTA